MEFFDLANWKSVSELCSIFDLRPSDLRPYLKKLDMVHRLKGDTLVLHWWLPDVEKLLANDVERELVPAGDSTW